MRGGRPITCIPTQISCSCPGFTLLVACKPRSLIYAKAAQATRTGAERRGGHPSGVLAASDEGENPSLCLDFGKKSGHKTRSRRGKEFLSLESELRASSPVSHRVLISSYIGSLRSSVAHNDMLPPSNFLVCFLSVVVGR